MGRNHTNISVLLAMSLAGLSMLAGCAEESTDPPPPSPVQTGPPPLYPPQANWPGYSVRELSKPHALEYTNGRMTLVVSLPDRDGVYDGVRFDWSGIVCFAELDGHTLIGQIDRDDVGEPVRQYALGTSEEFRTCRHRSGNHRFYRSGGLDVADGQVRIGSRRLVDRKLREPIGWSWEHGDDWIEFVQEFADPSGWGYRWSKRVVLADDGPAFRIEHRFQNTGDKPLDRYHYAHNWFRIDGLPPDEQTVMEFGRELAWTGEQPEQATVTGREVTFTDVLAQPEPRPWFVKLNGPWTEAENVVTVRRVDTGAGFIIKGDWPAADYHLYATGNEICPEPHYHLTVAPGESAEWTTRYVLLAPEP